MFESCGEVDLRLEAVAEISICRDIGMQNLQCYLLRRSRLFGEIDVACPPDPSSRIMVNPVKVAPFGSGMAAS